MRRGAWGQWPIFAPGDIVVSRDGTIMGVTGVSHPQAPQPYVICRVVRDVCVSPDDIKPWVPTPEEAAQIEKQFPGSLKKKETTH